MEYPWNVIILAFCAGLNTTLGCIPSNVFKAFNFGVAVFIFILTISVVANSR